MEESRSLLSVARFLLPRRFTRDYTCKAAVEGSASRDWKESCGRALPGLRVCPRRVRTRPPLLDANVRNFTHSLSHLVSRLTYAAHGRCRTEPPPRRTARRSETRTSLSLRSSARSNNQATRPLLRLRRRRRRTTRRLRPRRSPRLRTNNRRLRRNHRLLRLRRVTRRLRSILTTTSMRRVRLARDRRRRR